MSSIRTRNETGAIGRRLPEGVTYRQLNHWTTLGYLRPGNGANPGSGRWRQWPDGELDAAAMIARLRAAGIELPVAAEAARHLLATGRAWLPGGLLIAAAGESCAEASGEEGTPA